MRSSVKFWSTICILASVLLIHDHAFIRYYNIAMWELHVSKDKQVLILLHAIVIAMSVVTSINNKENDFYEDNMNKCEYNNRSRNYLRPIGASCDFNKDEIACFELGRNLL